MKFTQVHWLGKEFHATVVTQKFAKITNIPTSCYIYNTCLCQFFSGYPGAA